MTRDELCHDYSPYVVKKILQLYDKVVSSGDLCALVRVGEMENVCVISISSHTFARIRERLFLYDRMDFLRMVVCIIEGHPDLGDVIDSEIDKIEDGADYHKLCLLDERNDWFLYCYVYPNNLIQISTVVSDKKVYYVDPAATPVFLSKDGKVVVGINHPKFSWSRNTKYNKLHNNKTA